MGWVDCLVLDSLFVVMVNWWLYFVVKLLLWVINISVVFFFLFILNSKFLIFLLFFVFRLLVGLLVNKIFGEVINVLVIVICCCFFLDNWFGKWCVLWFNFMLFKIFIVCCLVLDKFVIFVGSMMFLSVVKFCISIKFWKIKLICCFLNIVFFFLFIVWRGVLFN